MTVFAVRCSEYPREFVASTMKNSTFTNYFNGRMRFLAGDSGEYLVVALSNPMPRFSIIALMGAGLLGVLIGWRLSPLYLIPLAFVCVDFLHTSTFFYWVFKHQLFKSGFKGSVSRVKLSEALACYASEGVVE